MEFSHLTGKINSLAVLHCSMTAKGKKGTAVVCEVIEPSGASIFRKWGIFYVVTIWNVLIAG